MIPLVTIIVSAGGASEQMLRTCVECMQKYKNSTSYKILLTAPSYQSEAAVKIGEEYNLQVFTSVEDEEKLSGSRIHASILNKVVYHIKSPYILTMDADLFVMGDGWLDIPVDMMCAGASVVGILHPYAPPPDDMGKTTMEYRIRSQLCNLNTHVAFQLVEKSTLKRLKVGFSDGDDTGLAIPTAARRAGLRVEGFGLTACARADSGITDHEYNRSYCLFFGDLYYHHGGGSREEQGHDMQGNFWTLTRRRVIEEGPQFLIGNLYRYKFDREEEVASMMVRGIMNGMQLYLQNHNRLFKE